MVWLKFNIVFIFVLVFVKSAVLARELSVTPDVIETKTHACQRLEKKLVASIDLVFYVKNCTLRLVDDSALVNILIQEEHKNILPLSNKAYSLLSMGKNYSYDEYHKDYISKNNNSLSLCHKYNKKIVTVDSSQFYYIDECKKRAFTNYREVSLFDETASLVLAVSPSILNAFSSGKKMPLASESIFIKQKTETQILEKISSAKSLCKKLTQKVVSFHDSFFYLKKCTLFKISDLTLDLQIKMEESGGIQELTVEQRLGIPEGKEIKSKKVGLASEPTAY